MSLFRTKNGSLSADRMPLAKAKGPAAQKERKDTLKCVRVNNVQMLLNILMYVPQLMSANVMLLDR